MRRFGPTVVCASLLGGWLNACGGNDSSAARDRCVASVPAAAVVAAPSGSERPPLGKPALEPVFGPCVERVSDHIGHNDNTAVHKGARVQAFNADGRVVLLRNGQVLQLSDKALVGQFPPADSAWVWSNTDPHVAYAIRGNAFIAFNFVKSAEVVLQRFARYQRLLAESDLLLPSRQNKWALGGELAALPGTEVAPAKELFLWDSDSQTSSTAVQVPADSVGRVQSPRWMQAAPAGEGLVVAWAAGAQPFSGIELYDHQGQRVRQLLAEAPACDMALDEANKSWLVCAQAAVDAGAAFQVTKHALTPAPPQVLLKLAIDHTVQISCAAHGTDTCVMGVSGGNPQTPFAGEVTAFSLRSTLTQPVVWRLAHHHSASSAITSQTAVDCPIEPSAVMPHATLDRTAQRVLFGSNWSNNCFAELYMIDFQ